MHTGPVSTVAPSGSPIRSGDAGTVQPAFAIRGDRELNQIYFASQDLTDDSPPGVLSIYRYTVASDELSFLTEAADTANNFEILQLSPDGRTLVFTTTVQLTPEPVSAGSRHIYAWHDDELSLIADIPPERTENGIAGIFSFWLSPNGRYFAFSSLASLTGFDNTNSACTGIGFSGVCRETYRFDIETGALLCVSCRPDGRPPTGHSYTGPDRADTGSRSFVRAVDDEGHVYFSTPDPLVARDINGKSDVYEFDGEQAHLITPGTGGAAMLGEVSESGDDVFFLTDDRLVAADTDNSTDVYDARVGGGLPSQMEVPPDTACKAGDCQPSASTPPPALTGSEGAVAPTNTKRRCAKGKRLKQVKGKQRCVKKHKQRRKNNHHRRQGR